MSMMRALVLRLLIGGGLLLGLTAQSYIPPQTPTVKTANYQVAPGDCNSRIQLGTGATGLFTLTVPAVTGFVAPCVITILNADTGRGKIISGAPSSVPLVLYPTLGFTIELINGAWAATALPLRWQTANATVFVDSGAGSDSNDCLASGASACATSAQAMTNIAKFFDNQGGITIKWGCASPPCTYTNLTFLAKNYVGPGVITLQGDTTTPDNVVMTCPACNTAGIFQFASNQNGYVGGSWVVQGFKVTSSQAGVSGIYVQSPGLSLKFGAMDFGSFTTSGGAASISCLYAAQIEDLSNYTISGGASSFGFAQDGCIMHFDIAVGTLTGTPAFTQFLNAHGAGTVIGIGNPGTNFSGAATGKRFTCTLLGLIDANGSSGSLPGNMAGTPTAGTLGTDGCYVN